MKLPCCIFALLAIGCTSESRLSDVRKPPADSWTIGELNIEVANVMMTDGVCRPVIGALLLKNDGSDTRITVLSWRGFDTDDLHEGDVLKITNITTVDLDSDFDGYWYDDLSMSKWSADK